MTRDEAITWLQANGWPNASAHFWNSKKGHTICLPMGSKEDLDNGISLYAGMLFITLHEGKWLVEDHHMMSRSFSTLEEACRETLILAKYLMPWIRLPRPVAE